MGMPKYDNYSLVRGSTQEGIFIASYSANLILTTAALYSYQLHLVGNGITEALLRWVRPVLVPEVLQHAVAHSICLLEDALGGGLNLAFEQKGHNSLNERPVVVSPLFWRNAHLRKSHCVHVRQTLYRLK